jgi:hypothetical protein
MQLCVSAATYALRNADTLKRMLQVFEDCTAFVAKGCVVRLVPMVTVRTFFLRLNW